MQDKPPCDEESKRRELLELVNDIPSIAIPENALSGKRPWFHVSNLDDDLDQFLRVLDWFVLEVEAT